MTTEANGSAAFDVSKARGQLKLIAEGVYRNNPRGAIMQLAEIVQALLPAEPSVSDDRVQEILDILDGFAVHEYEITSSIVMGRVVHAPEVVGSDFNLEDACDWAREQEDVKVAFVADGIAVVRLVDGTELVWERPLKKWALTVSDDTEAVSA